jgi:hypothetical protein
VQEPLLDPEAGGVEGSGGVFRVSVVVPLGVVISAEVASRLPGHHATNHPLPVLAWMSSPSLRTRVTPVTSASSWPSMTVYAPSLVESRWSMVPCPIPSEPLPTTREMDVLLIPSPVGLRLAET